MIIVDGEGTHNIDFKSYEYKRGTIFFIKKNQAHSFKINPDLKCYLLQFTDTFLNRLVKNAVFDIFDYMKYPVKIDLKEDSFDDILGNIDLLNNQLKKENDDLKEPILQSLLQSLLLQLKRKRQKHAIELKDKEQLIYQKFLSLVHNSHKYSKKVDEYSRELDISSRTLTNLLNTFFY